MAAHATPSPRLSLWGSPKEPRKDQVYKRGSHQNWGGHPYPLLTCPWQADFFLLRFGWITNCAWPLRVGDVEAWREGVRSPGSPPGGGGGPCKWRCGQAGAEAREGSAGAEGSPLLHSPLPAPRAGAGRHLVEGPISDLAAQNGCGLCGSRPSLAAWSEEGRGLPRGVHASTPRLFHCPWGERFPDRGPRLTEGPGRAA